jgi:hypothetical protein
MTLRAISLDAARGARVAGVLVAKRPITITTRPQRRRQFRKRKKRSLSTLRLGSKTLSWLTWHLSCAASSEKQFSDHNVFREEVDEVLAALGLRISAAEKKLLLRAVSWRVDEAPPVIRKIHKSGKADPLRGLFEATIKGKRCVVEYEPDADLRDTEQMPLMEVGGIEAFIRREVLPHAADAWFDEDAAKIGYEIILNRYFYKPQPLRSLDEIKKDIVALEKETEGLLQEIIGEASL